MKGFIFFVPALCLLFACDQVRGQSCSADGIKDDINICCYWFFIDMLGGSGTCIDINNANCAGELSSADVCPGGNNIEWYDAYLKL